MTVQELISELLKVEDKNREVWCIGISGEHTNIQQAHIENNQEPVYLTEIFY